MRTELRLSWTAYTSDRFDRVYNAHAERVGYRPVFSVIHNGDHAKVVTTTADVAVAQAIINELGKDLDMTNTQQRIAYLESKIAENDGNWTADYFRHLLNEVLDTGKHTKSVEGWRVAPVRHPFL